MLEKGPNNTGSPSPLNFFTKNPIQINPLRCLLEALFKRNRAKQNNYIKEPSDSIVQRFFTLQMVIRYWWLRVSWGSNWITPFCLRRNRPLLQMWEIPVQGSKAMKGPFVIGRPKDQIFKICKSQIPNLYLIFSRWASTDLEANWSKIMASFSNSSCRKGRLRLWSKNGVRCRRSTKPVSVNKRGTLQVSSFFKNQLVVFIVFIC